VPGNDNLITPMSGIENLTYEDANIILDFQKVWMEIFQWIRSYFRSVLENHQDQSAIATYVFQKLPVYVYNVFRKYLSEEEAKQLFDLIARMTSTIWQLVTAFKNNDKIAMNLSVTQWYEIADEIAAFFSRVNEYLNKDQLKALLYDYFNLTIQDLSAYFNGNYDQDIEIYNKTADKVSQIAAYIAMGFIAKRHYSTNSKAGKCIGKI